MSSDFGRGYATCLRQFTFHRARLVEMLETYRVMRKTHADSFDEARAVGMWANGSSDHLYELVRPRRGVPRAEWTRAKALQGRALHIGHGFLATSKSTQAEAEALLDEATHLLDALTLRGYGIASLEQAMVTDRALGLSPEKGDWSCSEDLSRRDRMARG